MFQNPTDFLNNSVFACLILNDANANDDVKDGIGGRYLCDRTVNRTQQVMAIVTGQGFGEIAKHAVGAVECSDSVPPVKKALGYCARTAPQVQNGQAFAMTCLIHEGQNPRLAFTHMKTDKIAAVIYLMPVVCALLKIVVEGHGQAGVVTGRRVCLAPHK
jgi:hypothetical protein